MSQSAYKVAIEGSDIGFDVKPNETIVKAAARHGIAFPSLCNVGECGSCRCTLRTGRIKLKKDISHHVAPHQLKQGHMLGCQSVAQSDVVLNVPTLSPSLDQTSDPVQTDGFITSLRQLNDDIVELSVELERPVTYRAGQYAHLTLPGVEGLESVPRSYSFVSGQTNRDPHRVTFHIRKVPGGAFTTWLFDEDRCGTKCSFSGPFGDFGWQVGKQKPLFIAGGSGFSPIHALLETCIENDEPLDAVLIYGARTRKDIYCLSRVGELQKRWPGSLTFIPVLSQESDESDWPGARGFVHDILTASVINVSDRTAY
ncbi:MAG: 2Fe-2S iron-sulfur cluster binding domain-containing protein, partial [Parvibaculaceae bacterium]|nr:2Fe-2S iron-sulfur cluster binding domain-containing protein [Parvibaculaceae bacterium]